MKSHRIDFSKLKALLIDFDGTLADSLPFLHIAYMTFLGRYGHPGNDAEFFELMGPSIIEIAAILKKRYALKESEETLAKEYQDIIFKGYIDHVELFPGVDEFLAYAAQVGLKLALVSSAPARLVSEFMTEKSISHFDAVVTCEMVQKAKPDPEIYLKALSILGVDANETLAIEDSENGITAALAAQIIPLQFDVKATPNKGPGRIRFQSWTELLQLFRLNYASI